MEIRAKCRRLKLEKGLGLVVIDYLQLMQGRGKTESRQQEISDISRSLKILAKEISVPVIALSQLSRAPEQRTDHRPIMSDLRESGAIEQDADIVMFIYRDDYYNEDSDKKNVAEVILSKHRNGSTGTVELRWFGEYTKFCNLKKD
jgi:replicative DNA helicase